MTLNPLGLQAQLYTAAAAAAVCAALLTWGLYWRGEYREAKVSVVALQAQGEVLAGAVKTCSAGADMVASVGQAALAGMAAAQEKIEKANLPTQRTIERIERVIERPTPLGPDGRPVGCDAAWDLIEADHQKARVTP